MPTDSTTLRRSAVALFTLCLVLVVGSFVLYAIARIQHLPLGSGGESLATGLAFVLADLTFAAIGALIAVRQPRNTMGWLLLAIAVSLAVTLWSGSYADFGLNARPGSLPAPALVNALGGWMWMPAVGLMATFVVLLFPDGRLPSRGWVWVAGVSAGVIAVLSFAFMVDPRAFDNSSLEGVANPLAVDLPTWIQEGSYVVFGALFPLCMGACAVAAVVRFRRARGVERQQLKWLAAAGSVFATFFGSMALIDLIFPAISDDSTATAVVEFMLPLTFCLVPLAIGAAVLRYRLYEIDLVINKAVVFGTLAFFITAVYVGIVVGVGRLAGGGDRPNLALSIAATAVVAVAFQPVRERVQRLANRLVYGQRATPYEVLSEFADRVGHSYQATELLPVMARTVAQGVGATRAEVWLATGGELVREATWPTSDGELHQVTKVRGIGDLPGDRVVEVRHQGELLGALVLAKAPGEPLTRTEEALIDDVAAQAGLVLRNVRLIEELRSSRERLVTTQDQERRRLERNLHDGAQQSLVSVALMIQTVRGRLGPDAEASPALEQAAEQLRAAITELRELARGIHPAILTERGLGPALRSLAERSPVPVVVESSLDQRLPATVEATVYFVVAEALTNVAKYAHATQVHVGVARASGRLVVTVSDDGIGGADDTVGSGLRGLADRLAVVDGTLAVDSPPGAGTTLTGTIPDPASLVTVAAALTGAEATSTLEASR